MKQVGARAFLKAEGFEFGLKPDRLLDRLRRHLDIEQLDQLDSLALLDEGPVRSKALYNLPKTLRQAHLLFSSDADRTVASFDWLAEVAAKADGAILDLGSGSGAFLRFLAARGKKQTLLGIDSSRSLVEIAVRSSIDVPNVEFRLQDFSLAGALDHQFEIVTSACALDWTGLENVRGDDIPIDLCLPGQFVLSPGVKSRVAEASEELLINIRRIVMPGGRLAMVERMKTFQEFIAFLSIAAEAGWRFDIEPSKRLRFSDQGLPGVVFNAAEPHSFDIDLRQMVAWWQGRGPWRSPITDEAAIVMYLDCGGKPSDIRQQVFHNGTMIHETGVFADGRVYSYRYATTGFRELRLS